MPCMLATGSYLQVGSTKTPHMGWHGGALVARLHSRRHICIFGSALAAAPPAVAFGHPTHAHFPPSQALAVLRFAPTPLPPLSHWLGLRSSKLPLTNHCCGPGHRQRPQRCCCIWQLCRHPATLTSSQERSQAQAGVHTPLAASYACQWCEWCRLCHIKLLLYHSTQVLRVACKMAAHAWALRWRNGVVCLCHTWMNGMGGMSLCFIA